MISILKEPKALIKKFTILKKQFVSKRLSLGAANMIYGVKKFPLNGPYPKSIKVLNHTSLMVKYDQPFFYNPQSENSGKLLVYIYCKQLLKKGPIKLF